MSLKQLSVIGAGRVGQTVAALLTRTHRVVINEVCNRSLGSAQLAVDFIGQGQGVANISSMRPSELWMISCVDSEIAAVSHLLAATGVVRSGDIVFHTSGALPSTVLAPFHACGAHVASIHPVKSFADPSLAVETFEGTWCGVEGDDSACVELTRLFGSIGASVFRFTAEAKELCHIGHVFASNYLVAILDCAQHLYSAAGVPESVRGAFLQSIVEGTLQNVSILGGERALTGPVKRGDTVVIKRHLELLQTQAPELCGAYAELAKGALRIAERAGLHPEKVEAVSKVLATR
jgi:predicted short-subunit dehydrogenase-like oxidoreductase (DUF2520 family)